LAFGFWLLAFGFWLLAKNSGFLGGISFFLEKSLENETFFQKFFLLIFN
jgi:hypothetical protein